MNPLYSHSIFAAILNESSETPDIHVLREKEVEDFLETRAVTEELCHPLSAEDALLSVTPETSPPKWHLAHTSWFFERFILQEGDPEHEPFHSAFDYLFNSYYETVGSFLPKLERKQISRPSLDEVLRYRSSIDEQIQDFFETANEEKLRRFLPLLNLGIHHERQHQELLLMDIKRNFYANPLRPAYELAPFSSFASDTPRPPQQWNRFEEGFAEAGADPDEGFAFDNETPRHRVWLEKFELAALPVTNGEYLEFIRAGGYDKPEYWLSDGWRIAQEEGWIAPLYWDLRETEDWAITTLFGPRSLDPDEPVSHISYYEAQAFAKWRGCRLPTEFEWEHAASKEPARGQFLEDQYYHPLPVPEETEGTEFHGLHGTLWEWTQSAYLPYPGYRPYLGSLGEYNAKFMANQFVLRGGSFATPRDHYRPTYRNFYEPRMRWQFSGFRLARDLP